MEVFLNPSPDNLRNPATDPGLWMLDADVVFLNHGSFGSCPREVLAQQREWRDRMERRPIEFLARELEGLLDEARGVLAELVCSKSDDLAFVVNATSGVNTVLRSLEFQPGDELLVTDHEYNACRNAIEFAAQRNGAKLVVVKVPFPIKGPDEVVEAILGAVTNKTRIALVDHITSQTALVMPIERIVRELENRGVDTLVDGAHAPGMVPLDLEKIGAAYYTGNCHKWLCAPKTAAFLHVRKERQELIHPLTISHGWTSPRKDRSKFLIEFGWTGTIDPTPALCVPAALRALGGMLEGGLPSVMARNRALALAGRKVLCDALNIPLPCPDEMIGSMASVPLPDTPEIHRAHAPSHLDIMQVQLMERHGIEVPVVPWPAAPKRLLRIATQLYNSLPQIEKLANALKTELSRGF